MQEYIPENQNTINKKSKCESQGKMEGQQINHVTEPDCAGSLRRVMRDSLKEGQDEGL